MKNKTVIWNFYPIDELNCAKSIGFDLFPGCEIRTDYYDKSKIDKNNCNIVLINYFFHPNKFVRIKEDLSWAAPPADAAPPPALSRRVAPDGIAYTEQEFVDFFGGTDEWDAALPAHDK